MADYGKRPDYNLTAMDPRETGKRARKGRIGVAWKRPDGSISIRLDPFVDQLVIMLFPPWENSRGETPPSAGPIPLDPDDPGPSDPAGPVDDGGF